jgi:hypothetical protein
MALATSSDMGKKKHIGKLLKETRVRRKLTADEVGYVRKDMEAGIYYTSGKKGPKGDVRSAAWSPRC